MIGTGIKHFHRACADSWFSHIAVEVPGENCRNEWLELVSDEKYGSLDKMHLTGMKNMTGIKGGGFAL